MRPTRKPPTETRSMQQQELDNLPKGGETEADIKEPIFEITSTMPFISNECKNMKPRIMI